MPLALTKFKIFHFSIKVNVKESMTMVSEVSVY